jgi:hypothetical protein
MLNLQIEKQNNLESLTKLNAIQRQKTELIQADTIDQTKLQLQHKYKNCNFKVIQPLTYVGLVALQKADLSLE